MVSSEEKEKCLKKLIRMSFQSNRETDVKEQLHELLLRDTNGGKVYRFRPFDKNGYSLMNLENGTLYCSKPSAFNDPFEAKPGMSFENMNEELYGDKLELLWDFAEKFRQVVNAEVKLEECDENEQRMVKKFLENEKLSRFVKSEKEQIMEIREDLDVKIFLQEFLEIILGDERFESAGGNSVDEIFRLFENISSESMLLATEAKSTFQWLAVANGIKEDIDELGLLYLLAKKLYPERLNEAEQKLNDFKEKRQNIYNHYESTCLMGCLSTTLRNQLMWAHYADSHKGFCIEYDYSEKADDVLKKLPYPVIYSDSRPQVPWKAAVKQSEENIEDAKEQMILTLLTKGREWEYENEWRILVKPENGPVLKMPKVSCVYLGEKICENNRKKVLEIAEKMHVQVKQMRMDADGYGMHVEDVVM